MIPKDTIAALWTGNDMRGPYTVESGPLVKPSQDDVDDLFAVLP